MFASCGRGRNVVTIPIVNQYNEDIKMKCAAVLAMAGSAAAFAPSKTSRASTTLSETQADLQAMAAKLNPAVKVRKCLSFSDFVLARLESVVWIRSRQLAHIALTIPLVLRPS